MKLSWVLHSIFIAGFVLLFSCSSGNKKVEATGEVMDLTTIPSMEADSITTLVSDSGRLNYRMKAPKLAIFDKVDTPYWYFEQGVNMITFAKDGNEDGDIKSKFAIYYLDQELWELREQVRAKSPQGKIIETELLYWDQKEKLIYSDEFVRVIEDDLITQGYGFKSDETFENWTLDDFEVEYLEE